VTVYGWDTSHYDGVLTRARLTQAAQEGIAFWSHKLGEDPGSVDPLAAAAYAAAFAGGMFRVMSGYWFLHPDEAPTDAAARCIAVADEVAAGWRDFPAWFFTADAERSTSLPSPATVRGFCDELAGQSDRLVVVYGSNGQYGNTLQGLGHPLWNAHYGTNPAGPFAAVYPGDSSAGWAPYSGQTPEILQYSSNAVVAGLTTCDANAYRGTVDEMVTWIMGGTVALTDDDKKWIQQQIATVAGAVWAFDPGDASGVANPWFRLTSPTHVPPGTDVTVPPSWFIRYTLLSLFNLGQALGVDLTAVGDRPYTAAEAAALQAAHDALVATAAPAASGDFTGTVHFAPPGA